MFELTNGSQLCLYFVLVDLFDSIDIIGQQGLNCLLPAFNHTLRLREEVFKILRRDLIGEFLRWLSSALSFLKVTQVILLRACQFGFLGEFKDID